MLSAVMMYIQLCFKLSYNSTHYNPVCQECQLCLKINYIICTVHAYPVIRLMHAHVYMYSRKYIPSLLGSYYNIYAHVQVINAYSSTCLQLYLCVIYTSQTCPIF